MGALNIRPDHGGTFAIVLRAAFVTLKIVAAIHREAMRLWLNGARLVPRPNASIADIADTSLALVKRDDYTGPR